MLRRIIASLALFVTLFSTISVLAPSTVLAAPLPSGCKKASVFDVFPHWYEYLGDKMEVVDGSCRFKDDFQWGDVWKIALAIIEILLRLAGMVAFGYTVFGGFKFVLSKGNPQEAAKARQTIIDALIGMVIAMLATAIVGFVGRSLS